MTAMFDTLKFARALRDGGQFTPEQAERLSDALSEAIAGEVASRADLQAMETTLGRKIDDFRAELKRDVGDLRAELKQDVDDLRAELKQDVGDLRTELVAAETRLDRNIDGLRAELSAVETRLDRKIDGLRADLKGDGYSLEAKFEAAKVDTIKWVVGIISFQSVAIIGAAIVLARILAH